MLLQLLRPILPGVERRPALVQPLVVPLPQVQLVVLAVPGLQVQMHVGMLRVLMHRRQRSRLREVPLQILFR
jgi:hypothetical protein